MAFDQRTASVVADAPAEHRPERVAGNARQRHDDEAPEVRVDLPAEEDDVLARERPCRERAGVEHDELARGRQQRVDQHQGKDGVEAVVADKRSQGVRDGRGHRGEQHRGTLATGVYWNLKLARFSVPSAKRTMSWRQVPRQLRSVFQTFLYWSSSVS